jgi:outer membrane protein OmpA-like peptidoglycan-associated protein
MIFLLRFFFALSVFAILFTRVAAQDEDEPAKSGCDKPSNKKAIKAYEEAMKSSGAERQKRLKEVLEMEPEFVDAWYALAKSNIRQGYLQGSTVDYLLKVVQLCPTFEIYAYYYLGDIFYGKNDYANAVKYLKEFTKNAEKIKKIEDYNRAESMIKEAKFFEKFYGNPVPFSPKLVANVSTPNDEVLPIISPDNELLFFTRRYEVKTKSAWEGENKQYIEKFVMSENEGSGFSEGDPIPAPFNQGQNEGGATITVNNKIIFFTVCRKDMKGYNNCDIWYCEKKAGQWGEIKNIGETINGKDTWETQPTVTSDGRTLYFVSIRPGNVGYSNETMTSDIYRSVLQPDGTWSTPENMGAPINTAGNEKSPFLHSDSQTLYFSSDGHWDAAGGYDIFYSKMDSGKWQKPNNIGHPINTESDELSFFVSADGKTAYFASNKLKGNGGWDLYSFELYKEARPDAITIVKGQLKDEKGEPLAGAKVEIKNAATKEVKEVPVDSADGKYAFVVNHKHNEDYLLTVKKQDYAFESHLIAAPDTTRPQASVVVKSEIQAKPLKVGGTYTLNNIYYKTNSAEIEPRSKAMLDEFGHYLTINPTMKVAIYGHTDDVGVDSDNLALSTDRAFTVYEYLTAQGIDKSRLQWKGFGETKPVASNDTEDNRAKNRRTEFVILSK